LPSFRFQLYQQNDSEISVFLSRRSLAKEDQRFRFQLFQDEVSALLTQELSGASVFRLNCSTSSSAQRLNLFLLVTGHLLVTSSFFTFAREILNIVIKGISWRPSPRPM